MIKIFLDCADLETIRKFKDNPLISGFTTNPTLMFKAGISDYEKFAKEVLAEVKDKPVSFEVFSDDFVEMEQQAKKIASWGENVYVKIPITNTKGEPSYDLIDRLFFKGLKLNITAITNEVQVVGLPNAHVPMIISVFAGRIADTGVNPIPTVMSIKNFLRKSEVLWASPREVLNIYQAEEAGADIITCTPDLIEKYEKLKGKNLKEFSLDTVKMFFDDGQKAGFKI